jgi:HEAT repeat protein
VGEEDPEVVKPVLPELIKLMENPEAWVRGNAARTLGRIGRKEPETVKAAIPRLIALLEDSYDYVRVCAVEALGWIGDAAALEPLRLLAQDSARARVSRGGKWIETTLGEIAREAIQSIEAGRKSPGS